MTIEFNETRDFAFLPFINYGEHGLVVGWMWWRVRPKFGMETSALDIRPRLGHREPMEPEGAAPANASIGESVEPLSQDVVDKLIEAFSESRNAFKESRKQFDYFFATLTRSMLVTFGLMAAENLLLYAKWKLRSEKYRIARRFCRKKALVALRDCRHYEYGIEALTKDLEKYELSDKE